MEFFPDGAFVRLQSRVHRTYLHADEDGESLALSPERASLNAARRVHEIVRNGIPYVLLYGAAYGRYLAATNRRAPFGLHGERAVQGYYDDPEEDAVVWAPTRVTDLAARDEQVVLMQHVSCNRLLRANGKHFKLARDGVSVDIYNNRSEMMHWVVEAIPQLPSVPIFPPPEAAPAPVPAPPVQRRRGINGIINLFLRRRTEPTTYRRTIRFMRADDAGNFNDQGWRTFQFHGRNAFNLRMAVTRQRREHYYFFRVTLCAWGGRHGRLTPLTADLPRNQEPMDVVALTVGSPPEVALRYPNVNAP